MDLNELKGTIPESLRHYAAIFIPIGAIGGFVSDVLQPLAPLSSYVFWASLAVTILLALAAILIRSYRRQFLPPLILASAFLTFSSIFLILQTKETEATGVMAGNFPAIAELQSKLGVISKDIAEIKQATQKIVESNERIAGSLEAIQEGFAGLTKSGGIIENAERAEEHYHNARIYEQRGDYGNARQSYNAFFAFKLEVIDPHLRYQAFLKVQEGLAGAREIYNAIYEQDKRAIIEFARLLLQDPAQRLAMMKTFIEANPDFAPAYYELSLEYSAVRKGTQSLGDKQAELDALERFKALHAEGKFLKYFIDQSVAVNWLEDADTRLKALAVLKQTAGDAPIRLLGSPTGNHSWSIVLQMQEIPREIFYKFTGEEAYRTTGYMDAVNPLTGLKIPNLAIQAPHIDSKTVISVKYSDVGNEMRGPFDLEFDPQLALVTAQKKVLDATKNSWVSFRDYDGKVLIYFTHLMSNRCAISEVVYGIDSEATPNNFSLEECNPKDPYNVGEGLVYIEAPANSKFATVQLTFKDGEKSEVLRFNR